MVLKVKECVSVCVCVGRCVRPKDIEHQKRQYREMENVCVLLLPAW